MKRLLLIFILLASHAWAVEPGEMLDDPALEERARIISQGIRCPVCQNESIDGSSAILARELRIVLRERLSAGDTDVEATDYLVARYGEFILLEPTTKGINLILWLTAPALLLIALGIGWTAVRGRSDGDDSALSDDEVEALDKIMRS